MVFHQPFFVAVFSVNRYSYSCKSADPSNSSYFCFTNCHAMKKILIVLLSLATNFQLVFAGTSGINGEYFFYLVPLVVLSIIWVGYEVKARIKAKRMARLEAMMALEAEGNNAEVGSSENGHYEV